MQDCGFCGIELVGGGHWCLPTYESRIDWKSDVFTTVCLACSIKLLNEAAVPHNKSVEADAYCEDDFSYDKKNGWHFYVMHKIEPYIYCPECGYQISHIEKKYARFDYDCPRCKKKKLSEFETVRVHNKADSADT